MELRFSTMDRLTISRFTGGMTENTHEKSTTLVLGGTGKTGRRVVEWSGSTS